MRNNFFVISFSYFIKYDFQPYSFGAIFVIISSQLIAMVLNIPRLVAIVPDLRKTLVPALRRHDT